MAGSFGIVTEDLFIIHSGHARNMHMRSCAAQVATSMLNFKLGSKTSSPGANSNAKRCTKVVQWCHISTVDSHGDVGNCKTKPWVSIILHADATRAHEQLHYMQRHTFKSRDGRTMGQEKFMILTIGL